MGLICTKWRLSKVKMFLRLLQGYAKTVEARSEQYAQLQTLCKVRSRRPMRHVYSPCVYDTQNKKQNSGKLPTTRVQWELAVPFVSTGEL
jgi:hypothetical protein